MPEIEAIDIEARGREIKIIVLEIKQNLIAEDFDEYIGKWEAYVCIREADGLDCIHFKVIGKLDFMLLGMTVETFKELRKYLVGDEIETHYLDTADKFPEEVLRIFMDQLAEWKKEKDPQGNYLDSSIAIVRLFDGKLNSEVWALQLTGKMRMILVGADDDYMKQLADFWNT